MLAAREAARLLGRTRSDRDALALGALLAGYVIDSTGYGLHHVLAQTLVRFAGVCHGRRTRRCCRTRPSALRQRAPDALAALDAAAGVEMEALARRAGRAAGADGSATSASTEDRLRDCVGEAAASAPS